MPGTILVVDDDPEFISQVDGVLSAAGNRVLTYVDTRAAMADLERLRGAVDAAIVPAELSNRVRSALPGVKVIAIALPAAEWAAGADAVLQRPGPGERFETERLASTVEDLLRRKKAA